MSVELVAFPKIARLNREVVITEKIDGINAAVVIDDEPLSRVRKLFLSNERPTVTIDGRPHLIHAQSRRRFITPETDDHGFARWVWDNAQALADTLGPGRHFGEWWGSGVNRGYGLKKGEKRFSLFNTKRWYYELLPSADMTDVPGLRVVPIVNEADGLYSEAVDAALAKLREGGSIAATGFMKPEGVVVYHSHNNSLFKVTLEGDEAPKSLREAIAVLDNIALDGCDPARAHGEADRVLLAYVPDEVKHAYKRVENRVGEFWYE